MNIKFGEITVNEKSMGLEWEQISEKFFLTKYLYGQPIKYDKLPFSNNFETSELRTYIKETIRKWELDKPGLLVRPFSLEDAMEIGFGDSLKAKGLTYTDGGFMIAEAAEYWLPDKVSREEALYIDKDGNLRIASVLEKKHIRLCMETNTFPQSG